MEAHDASASLALLLRTLSGSSRLALKVVFYADMLVSFFRDVHAILFFCWCHHCVMKQVMRSIVLANQDAIA